MNLIRVYSGMEISNNIVMYIYFRTLYINIFSVIFSIVILSAEITLFLGSTLVFNLRIIVLFELYY